MGNYSLGKCLPGKLPADPYSGQTDARLRLGSGVGLSGITGCSFNVSLTRCIKNSGQQKWHPATSSSQSESDTPNSYPLQVFALKNPALRTTKQVPTSLGWLHFLYSPPTSSRDSQFPLVGSTFPSYSPLINPSP